MGDLTHDIYQALTKDHMTTKYQNRVIKIINDKSIKSVKEAIAKINAMPKIKESYSVAEMTAKHRINHHLWMK